MPQTPNTALPTSLQRVGYESLPCWWQNIALAHSCSEKQYCRKRDGAVLFQQCVTLQQATLHCQLYLQSSSFVKRSTGTLME